MSRNSRTTSDGVASLNYLTAAERQELDLYLAAQQIAEARRRLIEFCCYVDPDQAHNYRARHLVGAAEYLEAIERGELRRLIVNWPPRHWKTSLLEKFCAWYLGRHPERSIILASYAVDLPLRSSRYVRELIEHNPRYRALFDTDTRRDSRDVSDWATTAAHRSSFRAVGVGGGITGMGGDVIIVDDPIKDWKEAQSEVIRQSTWDWLTKTLYQRKEPGAAILQSMTRWHEDDPTGRLIKAQAEQGIERFEQVRFPARAEKQDALGRSEGQYLWPERFSPKEYAEIETFVGPVAWALTYQQQDAQDEGFEIKRAWFDFFAQLPSDARWDVRWWDFAISAKETLKSDPDFHASVKACVLRGDLWLGKPLLLRCDWTEAVVQVMAHKLDEPDVRLGTGKAHADTQAVKAIVAKGFAIAKYAEESDKVARSKAWVNLARLRRVKLVGTPAEWEPFMAQWCKFPLGAHDDGVDCVSGVGQMLGLVFDPTPPPKPPEDPYRKMYYGRR